MTSALIVKFSLNHISIRPLFFLASSSFANSSSVQYPGVYLGNMWSRPKPFLHCSERQELNKWVNNNGNRNLTLSKQITTVQVFDIRLIVSVTIHALFWLSWITIETWIFSHINNSLVNLALSLLPISYEFSKIFSNWTELPIDEI